MAPRSRPSSRRRSNSSSRACTSPGGSTRTGSRAARCTTGSDITAFSPDPRDLGPVRPPSPDAPDAGVARRARYSRWDGRQAVPDLSADEILDELADDVMAEGDLGEALRRLMERGWRPRDGTRQELSGLNDLMERIQRRREELLDRYDLGDVLGDVRAELDEIVATERAGVERRLESAAEQPAADDAGAPGDDPALREMLRDVAARRLDHLNSLPDDIGDRIRGL